MSPTDPKASSHEAPLPEASILREAPPSDAEEARWMLEASKRLRAHFREALYGPYAQYEDDEETGSRPSWPGRG